jgi:hypothetical protein
MYKNKKHHCKISISKISINKAVNSKSSAWHKLLSVRYCKNILHKQGREWKFWKCACSSRKMHKVVNKTELINLKRTKMLNSNKCDIERLNTSDKYSLFICGDIELNPGPIYNPISILTDRLARIGLKPVNTVGDGNCFFRSLSHQIYQTDTHHAQIRALAIQHLINSPEHFIENNTDQSWMQYLQNM